MGFTRERFLSDGELERLLSVMRGRPRDHALFALLANTGIRPGEALALTRDDVHPHARPPWIHVARMKKKKAIVEFDDIEISRELAATLAAYLDTLPEAPGQLFAIDRRAVQRMFKFYARRADLWRRRSTYVLRHTAATRMYVETRDISVVQAMLGHEAADTSSIYAHVPKAVLVDTVANLPAFA